MNSSTKKEALLSILILARNEEKNIPHLNKRLTEVMKSLDHDYEVVLIDNASEDHTENQVSKVIANDSHWKYIRLSKNFGPESSIAAGLQYCRGNAIIILLSDLQEPPELIPKFVEKWKEGYDVVYGKFTKRHDDSILKSLGARLAYWLINILSHCRIPGNCGSFYLLDRQVVNALNSFRETDRYFRGLVHWVGFNQVGIEYERQKRLHGKSKAGFFWCIGFAVTAILSFSTFPLRIATLFGIMVTAISILLSILYIVLRLFYTPPSGIMTLLLLILFSLGLQATFLGLLGEYVARVYNQVKQRPTWLIHRTLGFDPDDDPITRKN